MPAVPRWQPHDFAFTAKANPTNPFLVSFSAAVTGPDGKSFTLPGFFDGNGTWKIRVSPPVEGHWSLVTKSGLPELNARHVTFDCVANTNRNFHGVLRVDEKHPHHFIFDDGTRFFMQGYEYDWLWALDMDKPDVPTVNKTLNLIAHYGFNCVLLNSYAYDTKWRPGKTGPDDCGPPLLIPWEGDNDHPSWSRMNLAYWRHYDEVMTALCGRGLEAHLLIKVYNKGVNWPVPGSPEEQLFFRWLVARYAAYPNIIWDFSKEAQRETNEVYKQDWLKYLRATDPYHHLVTAHDDDRAYNRGAYDGLADFRADQQHSHYHETILRQRARRNWPVVNVESDYECGPGGINDRTYGSAQSTDKTLRTLWAIAMAGGYTVYYYTYTAWDVIHPLDMPPGYAGMKRFGDFWRGTDYWLLQPSDNLVSAGWCLADPGREYVVYLNDAKPFTLEIKGTTETLSAEWFNPFTGESKAAGSQGNGTSAFNPPADWSNTPLVLHLRAK
jgi:Protein of unknown function (DUF4038)/Domain of unknown function (DUF5060)/Putative collagen-binding domain of a collagenase